MFHTVKFNLRLLFILFLVPQVLNSQDREVYMPRPENDISIRVSDPKFEGFEMETSIVGTEDSKKRKRKENTRKSYTETIIGTTYYDVQTNGSLQDRLVNTGDDLSAVWMFSDQSISFTDRGTGYNFGNGQNDNWLPIPEQRIESSRIGWPTSMHTTGGREIIISHQSSANPNLKMIYRDGFGTGDWIETEIVTDISGGVVTPHAVAAGADGNTIHLIAKTRSPYGGFEQALVYFRSLDQGDTWEVSDALIPEISTDLFRTFTSDYFSIAAFEDKIAIAVFQNWSDSFVLISENNGADWNYTRLVDFPVDAYDLESEVLDLDDDGEADIFTTTDGSGCVHISPDNTVHVAFGNMRYQNSELGDDENYTEFPFTDGLEYWNESFGADSTMTIAATMDMNGDNIVELEDETGNYRTSLTGTPQMASDESSNLFVSYAGVVETRISDNKNHRHIFLMTSEDTGTTWSLPVDVTPDEEYIGYEYAYASMANTADDYIHMIYQRDTRPGANLLDDHAPIINEIVSYRITKDLVVEEEVGINEPAFETLQVFPIPAENKVHIHLNNGLSKKIVVTTITGEEVIRSVSSDEQITLDVSQLYPGMYIMQIGSGKYSVNRKILID